ncbi:MAG: hypothetical protein A2508_03390 [Candidatus Lambdaproteobacteria bacterium RIFOXYD12_FULL_49_8]|nr:MAG: hypothetical protein A2508_03390 [Candidatus Lambdaproteobacteria bacterium RIFOXYD12_FULL_49_8]
MQNKIAVVFDFDDTLAPDSTTGLMEALGFDAEGFWGGEFEEMLRSGWDQVPGFMYQLVKISEAQGGKITSTFLQEWGKKLPLFEGVPEFFGELRLFMAQTAPAVELEFYLISSGIGEVIRHTPIAHEFTEIWASDFYYHPQGSIAGPKRVVSFTDKTRYLFQISKGIIGEAQKNYRAVNDRYQEFRIPMEQILFVGDGYTDIPCFSLLKRKGGQGLAVYSPTRQDSWKKARSFVKDERVELIARAEYSPGSALSDNLRGLLQEIAQKIGSSR